MSLLRQIKDTIQYSRDKNVFTSFDDLYVAFPTAQQEHSKAVNPINLKKMCFEAKKVGLEPFSKCLKERGIWFRVR